jgi:hypothetical protein
MTFQKKKLALVEEKAISIESLTANIGSTK